MSTNNISSNFAAAFPRLNTAHELKQSKEDIAALGSALQSQDLAGAKDAFAALMRDSTAAAQGRQASGQAPLLSETQRQGVVDAVGALGQELQAGDIDGAQAAYAQLQQATQVFRMAVPPSATPAVDTPADSAASVLPPEAAAATDAVDAAAEAQAAVAPASDADAAAAVQESDVAMTADAMAVAAEASVAPQSVDGQGTDSSDPLHLGQENMQSLEDALAAQDLRGAQTAYAALLEDGVNFLQSYQPSPDYVPSVLSDEQRADTTQALGQLGDRLQAGDMAGAQAAYQQLQASVQANRDTINTTLGDTAGGALALDSSSDPAATASSSVNMQA